MGVVGNVVSGNGEHGIQIIGSRDSDISWNDISGSGLAGISIEANDDDMTHKPGHAITDGVSIRHNVIYENADEGIAVLAFERSNHTTKISHLTISDNDGIHDNGSNGIQITIADNVHSKCTIDVVSISGNSVNDNAGYWLYVSALNPNSNEITGFSLGAGNSASGNGTDVGYVVL